MTRRFARRQSCDSINGMQEAQEAELAIPQLVPANFAGEEPAKRRERPRSPLNGQPVPKGRAKGTPNKVTQTLREAVEMAARDCHPHGLAGWLVERAQGGVQDRQIFAGLVGKVIPIQVNQQVNGGISINLNWLGGRSIGTVSAQPKVIDAQTIDLIEDSSASNWTANETTQGQRAPEAVGARESASGYPTLTEVEIAPPAAFQGPARGPAAAADPPPPVESGPGG